MRLIPLFNDATEFGVATLLELGAPPAPGFRAGSVRLAPGQRVPAEGLSVHAADEVSYVVAGSLSGVCGGEEFKTFAGEVSLIPAGEEHWAVAGPDGAEIFWCWYGNVSG
ncbi:MAG: cupin domain-containing protein [Trueperaceae bacterium]|nr:cupin domain-containing protein [Trueperaceae bacterium]